MTTKMHIITEKMASFAAYMVTPVMMGSIVWLIDLLKINLGNERFTTVNLFTIALPVVAFGLFYSLYPVSKSQHKIWHYHIINRPVAKVFLLFAVTVVMALLVSYLATTLSLYIHKANQHLAMLVFGSLLWCMDTITNFAQGVKRKYRIDRLLLVLLIVLFGLGYQYSEWYNIVSIIGSSLIVMYSVYLFTRVASDFVRPYNRLNVEIAPAKTHVVVFLSSLRPKERDDKNDNIDNNPQLDLFKSLVDKAVNDKRLTNAERWQPFIDALEGKRHPWEMSLRALKPHLDTLTNLSIVVSSGSQNTPGSICQVAAFLPALAIIFSNRPVNIRLLTKMATTLGEDQGYRVLTCKGNQYFAANNGSVTLDNDKGIDFNNFEQTDLALKHLLAQSFCKPLGYDNTIIDITGGTKTASVAATLAAISLDTTNQYVDTNVKDKVHAFDFRFSDMTKG
jgi:hypothetical protein